MNKKHIQKYFLQTFNLQLDDLQIDEIINVVNGDKIENNKFHQIVDFYNQIRNSMPEVTKITTKRISAIKARIKEHGEEKVLEVLQQSSQSEFLNGKNYNGWTASFDWIMSPTNFIKIAEGNYKNKNNAGNHQSTNKGFIHQGTLSGGKVSGRAIIASRYANSGASDNSSGGNNTIEVEAIVTD